MTRNLGGPTMHENPGYGNAARVVLLLVLLASSAAQAEEDARVALSVDAPEDCATRESISAAVRTRGARIELAPSAPLELQVVLQRASEKATSAVLRVEWPDGRRSERSLTAPSCAEAADALALLIALTLDPTSARAQLSPAPASEPSATDPPATQAVDRARPPASDSASAPPTDSASAVDEADEDADAFSHFALGLAAQGTLGPAPRIMPGVALIAHIAWRGAGLWTPLFQVRVARSWLGTERAAGRADFELDAAHAAACVIGLRGEALAARACASGAIGSLRARGSDTYDPKAHARLWLSAGAELLLTAELIGPLEAQAGAGASVPFYRHRFAFAPAVFHRVAPIAGFGHLGLLLRFP
jgi:hypothetical protein